MIGSYTERFTVPLTALVKTRLKRTQYCHRLIEGLVAKAGLDLRPP
jgi:hypothetical protein